jgi:hypothetical protein
MQVDNDKLNEFIGRFVGDLGAGGVQARRPERARVLHL